MLLDRFARHHRRRSAPALVWLLLGWLTLLPAVGMTQESTSTETSTEITPAHFDDSLADDWALTSGQVRLLTALGVVAGMVGLAALAAWSVTWLADRGPTGGPAPLIGGGDFGDGDGRS